MYVVEFERFKDGLQYTIDFDDDGVVHKATIYIGEIDREVEITPFVSTDLYWLNRIGDWLYERKATADERKYWDASKVSNE